MEEQKWEVVLRVAELGSFSLAAQKLGFTTSGVSRLVAGLEKEMGLRFFERGKAGASPTRELLALMDSIREYVRAGENLRERAAALQGGVSGDVSVGTAYASFYEGLSQAVRYFGEQYPGVKVELIYGNSTQLAKDLLSGNLDICFISKREGDMIWHSLGEDRLMAWVRADSPWVEKGAVPLWAFAKEPYVDIYPGADVDNARLFQREGIVPRTAASTTDSYAAGEMVAAGLGIAMNNECNAREGRGTKILPLSPSYCVEIGMAMSKKALPAARLFFSHLQESAPTWNWR